ncbi:nematode cuticle collagen domain protein [Oesophagostomum dentatum]|uniref:Nematode cuticle collagen domain protein n=1 Tax=Oesophagostomum dentatum TaxID=61180 RepID=A0A0B1TC65_OESDE|nr:nematode cuticle collagen domain protein [Oesophagostomum dentatum]
MDMEWQQRCRAYRFVSYSAVAFSMVAILGVATTLPMVYNYVHHVRSAMQNELNFCRSSARDIWSEVGGMRVSGNRTARTPGPKGPNGGPGQPGNPGNPGRPGNPGNHAGPGNRGVCPQYCAVDGGIFYADGTRR